jgi:CTP:molybdopterin cytidylyltransferase MocA
MSISDQTDPPKLATVIIAAGEGRRFGSDKMVAMIGLRTVLERSIDSMREAFPDAPVVVERMGDE